MIKFTSYQPSPARGDWQFLQLSNSSILRYAVVEYANRGVYARQTSPIIEYNIFRENQDGLYLELDAKPLLSHNTIKNNNYGIYIVCSSPLCPQEIHYNSIYSNSLYNLSAFNYLGGNPYIVNAQNNWWGTIDSQEIAAKILDRDDGMIPVIGDFGQTVVAVGKVIFEPFLYEPEGIPLVRDVSLSKVFFEPKKSETTSINYTLFFNSNVTIKIFDSNKGVICIQVLGEPQEIYKVIEDVSENTNYEVIFENGRIYKGEFNK